MSDPLIESLLRAVEESPSDVPLRLLLAEMLIERGRASEAVTHCAVALQLAPADDEARALMASALNPAAATPKADTPAASTGHAPAPAGFDWAAAEAQLSPELTEPLAHADVSGAEELFEVERPRITLADVGGLADVKERIEVSFLAPMRNPDLMRRYGKSLRGGLLLYGPPGCGKTYIARAVAGEMGAHFINVALTDVLDMYVGNSEANLHGLFTAARLRSPCVVFLDELDALGAKRSLTRHTATRGVVNTLLAELDGADTDNEGVYVMAATNAPWDVDPALRRPGRLDRTIPVLPPDEPARLAILQHHLANRPVGSVDLPALARRTRGHTGADLAHVCETAAERALMSSIRSGVTRAIEQADLVEALREVKPSAGGWFDIARNVVEYADRSGEYADLRAYMKREKLL